MPGYDGTGPEGEGPMTGGMRGVCAPGSARDPGVDPNDSYVFYRRFYPGFRSFQRMFGSGRPRWGLRRGGRGRGRGRW